MKNIVLRPLRAEDAERMLAFARAAGQETKNLTFGPEGLPLGTEAERAYLAAHGQGADSCELGAFDGETLAATGSVSRVACRPRMAHRFSVAVSVRKSYWGRGHRYRNDGAAYCGGEGERRRGAGTGSALHQCGCHSRV